MIEQFRVLKPSILRGERQHDLWRDYLMQTKQVEMSDIENYYP